MSWLARRDVTVSLSGDGGDELFGGYTRYLDMLRRPDLPAWGRPLFRMVGRALPHLAPGRGRLLDRARPPEAAYAGTVALPLAPVDGGMAAARLVPRDGEFGDLLADAFEAARARDFVSQMTLVDVATYLPGDILTKVDRASMAVSLEARVPLLDHPLVEFALALPAGLKIQDGSWGLRCPSVRGSAGRCATGSTSSRRPMAGSMTSWTGRLCVAWPESI